LENINFTEKLHNSTKRDYVGRVTESSKADNARIAKKFGKDYWDGDRRHGYGGYKYDGRWYSIAEKMAKHYNLKPGDKILDIGCGKGFLLYEFTKAVPGIEIAGIDISEYAIENSKEEVREYLKPGLAQNLPFEENSFDFVFTLGTFHNLYIQDLKKAVKHVERVSKGKSYIMVESYKTEEEKANLLYWQLTCECFFTPEEWRWLFEEWGYTGDYGFIFFE
jgi:protein-L-isoaspartate(D-aspartate) O-methyltransferase